MNREHIPEYERMKEELTGLMDDLKPMAFESQEYKNQINLVNDQIERMTTFIDTH